MQKEGVGGLFNSHDGKLNIVLLSSIVLIFILTMAFTEAMSIKLFSPGNSTFNATSSRNINFTFNVTWSAPGENLSNCSLFVNTTSNINAPFNNRGWAAVRNVSNGSDNTATTFANITNSSSLSYMNFTFNQDGNFTWSIGCLINASEEAFLNFSVNTTNFTVVIDTIAPRLVALTPNASLKDTIPAPWTTTGSATGNFTAWPITFQVNISDNNTHTVWYLLNGSSTNQPTWIAGTSIGQLENSSGSLRNVSMNRDLIGSVIGAMDSYAINVSLNFSSSWRGPGAHSVIFCANDTAGNKRCLGSFDVLFVGVNITQMEEVISGGGLGTIAAIGLNITYGNGTEISSGSDNSSAGSGAPPAESYINPLANNLTFVFNFTNTKKIHIVGLTIDEVLLGNASNTNITTTAESGVLDAVGRGFSTVMAGADLRKFIPDFVRYKFGVIEVDGVGLGKRLYCTGTDLISSPNCTKIQTCNATAFGVHNDTNVLNTILSSGDVNAPNASACYLEGDKGELNGVALTAGKTYIFIKHFSQGTVGNDTGAPEIQFFGSLVNGETARSRHETPPPNAAIFNTTSTSIVINFTVTDINSSGINMSIINTINLTLAVKGEGFTAASTKFYISGKNLTCVPNGSITNSSVFNITGTDVNGNLTDGVNCTVTVTGLSNGTKNVTVMAKDLSNNSNINITSVLFTVDQIPPQLINITISNASSWTTEDTLSLGNPKPENAPVGEGSWAQGSKFFVIANYTDNLTRPFHAELQFFNTTNGSWQTLNTTTNINNAINLTNSSTGTNATANFTFTPTIGRNEFEGRNVTFRVRVNDTVGNTNLNASNIQGVVGNITIQINDTYAPTITINGTIAVNNSNITATSISVVSWALDENNNLAEINISVDGNLGGDVCNKFTRYTTASGPTPNSKRNSSFATSSTEAGCTLSNGSHYIEVSARDTWGNTKVVFHNFTVGSGINPQINLSHLANNYTFNPVNGTSVTTTIGINITATAEATGILKNLSFTNSCNSTLETFTNKSSITPFRSCAGTSGNQTVTVTVFDFSGNSVTKTFQFNVDEVAPSLEVQFPTNNGRFANNVSLNWSVRDGSVNISFTGYYLDGSIEPVTLNFTRTGQGTPSTNFTDGRAINFTAGTHTIKFTANDSLGNSINSSVITFAVEGPINFIGFNSTSGANTTLALYNLNMSFVNLTNASGDTIDDTRTVTDQTLNLLMTLNTSKGINLTITFNASAANWDKYNFSVVINESKAKSHISNNFTLDVVELVTINNSILEFIPSNNSYYGIVKFVMNASNASAATSSKIEMWFFKDITDFTQKRNVTECSAGFNPSFTFAESEACWNNTDNRSVKVYVPHFSGVALVNNSGVPTVNVTYSAKNQTVGVFLPNITVSSDTISCVYSINSSQANKTMAKSGTTCIGQTEQFKNLEAANAEYNITFTVNDSEGNVNNYLWDFNVSDSAAPNTPNSTRVSVSPSTTTATVTISGMNESVNATVQIANGSSISAGVQTDFNETQAVSLSGLGASTKYHFNVTVCDFNGNCAVNSSELTFTTSAAAAAEAAAAAAAAAAGGGGGAAAPSNEAATASRKWDSLSAGTSAVLAINNKDIAVTGVVVDVRSAVTNAEIKVASLTSNPIATAAAAKVYQYLQITRGNIADADASKITIHFRIPKSWLTSNGIAENDIVLYRYSEAKWNALSTAKTGADANNVLYSATTPGFSTFAVGGKEAAPAAPPAEAPAAPAEEVPVPTAEVPAVPEEKPAVPEAKKPLSTTAIAWIVVAIIVVVAAIGYYMWQKKKAE